jgi:hypothetical protein
MRIGCRRARCAAFRILPPRPTSLRETARRWYAADADCPAWGEPGGDDFLSPALIEAECLRRLSPTDAFAPSFDRFPPRLAQDESATLLPPGCDQRPRRRRGLEE